jgi:hypothetical protein
VNDLRIDRGEHRGASVLRPVGVLELSTYAFMRDRLLKEAVEQPRAVLVRMDELEVPSSASLAVFSSANNQVSVWPGVPIALFADDPVRFGSLAAQPVARFVRVHRGLDAALSALGRPPSRQRLVRELPRQSDSARIGRRFVAEVCRRWEFADAATAVLIAGELVENVLRHTTSAVRLRLELRRGMLTVAVSDTEPAQAMHHEHTPGEERRLGLAIVAGLATAWGCTPCWYGKTVWAVLRPSAPRQGVP